MSNVILYMIHVGLDRALRLALRDYDVSKTYQNALNVQRARRNINRHATSARQKIKVIAGDRPVLDSVFSLDMNLEDSN